MLVRCCHVVQPNSVFGFLCMFRALTRTRPHLQTYTSTFTTMTTHREINLDASPPIHREMKTMSEFDRNAFQKSFQILAARIPIKKTNTVVKAPVMKKWVGGGIHGEDCLTDCVWKSAVLNLPKIRTMDVNPADPGGDRLVLLRVKDEGEHSITCLPTKMNLLNERHASQLNSNPTSESICK